MTATHSYYHYKRSVWKQRLDEQRNAILSQKEGKRKYVNDSILEESLHLLPDEDGPFYLVHPDLHASNVIIDRKNFHVVGIIDWEGTCFLPLASSCVPPKALSLA